ncbi:hypothetical protein RB653_001637 [Dictyostelium firmibasis]|uniref:BRCT domain-containing protein n=1 Tax=Dictyostelium firmibasis TaxID=79012 RepID=A0AAN7Z293_9MYCE
MASKFKSVNSKSCNNHGESVEEKEEVEQLFFKGKSFCLDFPTSLSPTKKSQYTQFIKKNGGKIDFSITSKTNYYITHHSNIISQSLRTKNALKLNIAILLDTFIYDCFNNKINSLDFINYLYINGVPANETINETVIENSISQTFFFLCDILSTFEHNTKPSLSTNDSLRISSDDSDSCSSFVEEEEEDRLSESSYGLDMFSVNSDSDYHPHITKTLPTITTTTTTTTTTTSTTTTPTKKTIFNPITSTKIFSPTSLISKSSNLFTPTITTASSISSPLISTSTLTTNLFDSITNDINKSNKPLSKFELLLLQKKENADKKKIEIQKIEEEKKRIKDEQLELKRKEKQEKLEVAQKEKQIKIESEKERRKFVLEKTKSSLSPDQLIKLTKSNITVNNNNNNNSNNNNKNNINNKLKSTSFGLQIDHEGIRIKKEQEKQDRLKKVEIEKETKKREKEERTRLYHGNKIELERIEKEEKIRKQKESLEAFLKRQEKRLAKEKKEQKEREELKQNGIDAAVTTTVVVKEPEVDEDLRKLFVGGVNCDDITNKLIDPKKLEKIRERRIQELLKLFDKFGQVQKRTINSSKGLFFITYKDIESCTKAVEFYSTPDNRKFAIEEITKKPKKSPLYNPNQKFYVKLVKSNEKAKKKQFFDKNKIENLKITAKNELQKEEDAEFADWKVAK